MRIDEHAIAGLGHVFGVNVLVTGGAGFIGSHLVDALVAKQHFVTVLDDLSTGRIRNLGAALATKRAELVDGSVRDANLVAKLVRRNDYVFHLAAAVGVRNIVLRPLDSILTNVQGTENVLASCDASGVPVLLASTSEIYGRNTDAPFREDSARVLGATWVHRWSYSTSKAIDEHIAFAYAERGLPVVIVRYFNSYGPRLHERGYGSVIARFAGQALAGLPLTVHGDGQQTRCFTHVADTVRGTILAATTPGAVGSVFNIGSTEEIAINELARLVRDEIRSQSLVEHVPYEADYGADFEDTRRRVPDTTRAETTLGFSARVKLIDGLRETLTWFRVNLDRPSDG